MSLSIKHINPPQGLENSILIVIARRERFSMFVQSGLSVLSFIAFFPLGSILVHNFSTSSFSQYMSLLFTNEIGTYWQELSLSIVESLPILSIVLFLSVGIVFLYSLTRAIRNRRQFLALKLSA